MTVKTNDNSTGGIENNNPTKTQNGTLTSEEIEPFIKDPQSPFSKHKRMLHCILIWAVFFFIIGSVVLVFGLYKYHNTPCLTYNETMKGDVVKNSDQMKLFGILNRVYDLFFEIYPNEAQSNVVLSWPERFHAFKPYDAHWETLKARTDHSRRMRKELADLNIDLSNLRPREKKAYAQLEHYLDHNFGIPYHEDYYAGDWMTGPNYGCWQSFCTLTKPLQVLFSKSGFIPRSVEDVKTMIEKLKMFRKSVFDYRDNMVLGVKSGFVRSVETCDSGYETYRALYPKIVEDGPQGELYSIF